MTLRGHPCTTVHAWPWEDPPTSGELGLRLGAELAEVADERAADAVAWRAAFRIPDSRAIGELWVARAAGLPTERPGAPPAWGDGECERAGGARWIIGLRTPLVGEAGSPRHAYRRHLRLALAATPDLPALVDVDLELLRTGLETRDVAWAPVPPRADELIRVHLVGAREGRVWGHTHGLQRLGRPDLEVADAPGARLVEVGELLRRAARWLVSRGTVAEPDTASPYETIPVAPDLVAAARPLGAPPEVGPGCAADRAGGDHGGPRRALVAGGEDRADALLDALAAEPPVLLDRDEARERAVLARDRWPRLGLAFASHGDEAGWRFTAKARWGDEHLGFDVLEVVPDRFRGRLLNEPIGEYGLARGDEVEVELARLSDWSVVGPDGTRDPWTPEDE